jgi:hypothetical protein
MFQMKGGSIVLLGIAWLFAIRAAEPCVRNHEERMHPETVELQFVTSSGSRLTGYEMVEFTGKNGTNLRAQFRGSCGYGVPDGEFRLVFAKRGVSKESREIRVETRVKVTSRSRRQVVPVPVGDELHVNGDIQARICGRFSGHHVDRDGATWATINQMWEAPLVMVGTPRDVLLDSEGRFCFDGVFEDGSFLVNIISEGRVMAADSFEFKRVLGRSGYGIQSLVRSLGGGGSVISWSVERPKALPK